MALRTQGRKAWEGAWCVLSKMYWTPSRRRSLTPLDGDPAQGPEGRVVTTPWGTQQSGCPWEE